MKVTHLDKEQINGILKAMYDLIEDNFYSPEEIQAYTGLDDNRCREICEYFTILRNGINKITL